MPLRIEKKQDTNTNLYFSSQGHKGLEGPKGEVGAPGSKVIL